MRSPIHGIETVAIAYLTFALTWFECDRYAHIVWWALSLVSIANFSYNNN